MRTIIFAMAAAALGLATSSCSSVQPVAEKRMGLLDRLAAGGGAESGRAAPLTPESQEEPNAKTESFRWPLAHVRVTSPFGQRKDGFHEGVDLHAPSGTPVYACEAGKVLYANSRIRGYGRMVVIRHVNGLTTVYAHNSVVNVRKGEKVKKGQKIALSGKSGRASGPHLHFEMRQGISAVDPARWLPHPGSERRIAHAPR